jgi:CHAT domain-containing protein/tetratricopeptide (TPR) repeat protein
MIDCPTGARAVLLGVIGLASIAGTGPVSAQDLVAKCQAEARPQVVACAEGKQGSGDRAGALAQCRASVGAPLVRACMQREQQKAAAPPPSRPAQAAAPPAGATSQQPLSRVAAPQPPATSPLPAPSPPLQSQQDQSLPKRAETDHGGFVAPPRTISDITAILDQEKPDPAKAARLQADANAAPPASKDNRALAAFYYQRAQARELVARRQDAISDCETSLGYEAKLPPAARSQFKCEEILADQYFTLGNSKRAIEIDEQLVAKYQQAARARLFPTYLRIIKAYLSIGQLDQADAYLKRSQELLAESRTWKNAEIYQSSFEAFVETGNALLLDAHSRFAEAAQAYDKSALLLRDAVAKSIAWPVPPVKGAFELMIDRATALEGRAKARQGRRTEAEADIRRALLSRLDTVGKYHASTASICILLAVALREEARYADAEKLARSAIEIYRFLGYAESEPDVADALNELATDLYTQRKWDAATAIYASLDEATKDWEPDRRDRLRLDWGHIFTDYDTRKVGAGIALARAYLERARERGGERGLGVAMGRAILGAGLTLAGRDQQALQEYGAALPTLLGSSGEGADDDTAAVAADYRLRRVLEPYLFLLARNPGSGLAAEAVQISDLLQGRSVSNALTAASARAAARDPALAGLVREEQDLQKQIGARLGGLTNMLALPKGERDDGAIAAGRAEIDRLSARRTALRRQIEQNFPGYGNLVSPRAANVADIRAALGSDEALISIYLGIRSSFVWAVPKDGPVAFAEAKASATQIEERVAKLRASLDPDVQSIDQIPAFDVNLAHEIYSLLLEPVAAGWKGAKSLIVVTNGALGKLPLSLLPTAPSAVAQRDVPYAGYRAVPWLARSHAVTVMPSASTLIELRRLPPPSPEREKLIGFGDPLFNEKQVEEAASDQADDLTQLAALRPGADAAGTVTRGLKLTLRASAEGKLPEDAALASLPRLPDTALELKAIARVMGADPLTSLYLGKNANEENVARVDLSHFRVVDFATHGLVPGDIDGLDQPALALTPASISGSGHGNGLLTMDKILSLKLDADWVILSACNTAAGAREDAEAATGLARAFLYAGTRALLMTNWSVESASARDLVTDLFRRQAADPHLARAEALRQAMLAMIDGPGRTDSSGRTIAAYAHPLFWAPYSIIGDGAGP